MYKITLLPNAEKSSKKFDKSVQLKIAEKISSWIVYYDRKTPALVLEFYIVSDNNMFFKLQYSADPDKFQKNRLSFEELKDSFKFRFGFY